MKPIGEAAATAARHRKWHWCRRHNSFSDMPIWRMVADELRMPLYQVVAFVNRLEEFANVADQRGHVGDFSAREFGAALGMPAEEAARIFAALEHPDISWIAYDHIATFQPRNPDREDDAEAARERKRRQRQRDRGMKEIACRFARGEIDEAQRRGMEAQLLLDARLSTRLTGHNVSPGDIVTVTPEKNTDFRGGSVENSGDGASGQTAGLAEGASGAATGETLEATRWVDSEGSRMLVEYLQIRPQLAQTYIERWRRDVQDDVALAEIIGGAEGAGYIGARFHTIITDQIKRFIARRLHGAPLPLMPPRPQQPRSGVDGHNVTPAAPVDNTKRSA